MLSIQQIIRLKSRQAVDRTRKDSKYVAGLMVRKGIHDFQVIKAKAKKIKTYGMFK